MMFLLEYVVFTFMSLLIINFANGIPQKLKNMIAPQSGKFSLHEIYDSFYFLGWSNINNMNQVHMWHTASLLRDGKVLVASGSENAGYVILY
jgi:hypothetical protein